MSARSKPIDRLRRCFKNEEWDFLVMNASFQSDLSTLHNFDDVERISLVGNGLLCQKALGRVQVSVNVPSERAECYGFPGESPIR